MFQGIARLGIVLVFIVIVAAGSVSAFEFVLDTTQKLTVSISTDDDTFYADLAGDCDNTSVDCG
jgi:hypothetical protein